MLDVIVAIVLFFAAIAVQIWILETYFPRLHSILKAAIIAGALTLIVTAIRGWICGLLCG